MSDVVRVSVELEQLEGYQFLVKFNWGDVADLLMDEPRPLGARQGPNASRLLAAAIGNCLSASLMYCLAKESIPAHSVHTSAVCEVARNEAGRVRVKRIEVRIVLGEEIARSPKLGRCLRTFQDYCTLSSSVREGIPVDLEVRDEAGTRLDRA